METINKTIIRKRARVGRRQLNPTMRPTQKRKIVKNVEKEIVQKLKNIKIGSVSKYNPHCSHYKHALLFPEIAIGARISGLPDYTVPIRRKYTFNVATNALGAANVIWQPQFLADVAGELTNSTLYSTNTTTNTTYDGTTTLGSTSPVAIKNVQNITAGAVMSYRFVSASMHVVPQASVLNQAGTIHCSVIKSIAQVATALGAAASGGSVSNLALYPTFQDEPLYKAASVSNQEGARLVWVPNDTCFTEFTNINFSVGSNDPNESVNTLVAVIVGTVPASTFRIDLYTNLEVTVPYSSVLSGMQGLPDEKGRPEDAWFEIETMHKDQIITVGRSISNVAWSRPPPEAGIQPRLFQNTDGQNPVRIPGRKGNDVYYSPYQ
jgi:hypothetical protein